METAAHAPQTTATFTRLRDESWGLRIVGPLPVTPGQIVRVTKKDGTATDERVGEVVWSDGKGVTLARVGRAATPASPRPAYAGGRFSGRLRTCGYCGGSYPANGLCPRCGDEG